MKGIGKFLCGCMTGALLCAASGATAGGLYLYEIGTQDVGTAAAGYAARAQDASTVFTNPAGMTRLTRPELQFGLQTLYVDEKFSPDGGTTVSGSSGDPSEWVPGGSFFYSHPVTKDLRIGIGVFGNFGLSLKYEDGWVGRYYTKEATLEGLTIMPAVAYRVAPGLSIGAGFGMMYAMLKDQVAIRNSQLFDPQADGNLELKDHDWGFNGKFGILYELSEKTRFGATYMTATRLKFDPSTKFSGLGPGLEDFLEARGRLNTTLNLTITAPQAVMVSAYHEITDKWALLCNVGWEDWSQFGRVDVGIVDNTTREFSTNLDYDDTWHVALGAQYKISDPWLLSFGVAYDSSMIGDDQRSPSLPLGETWRFGLGGQYKYSGNITVGGAYEFVWMGDLPMDVSRGPVAGTVSGSYKDAKIHALTLNMNYKF